MLWSILCIVCASYLVSLSVYRLYFSPVAAFPGPRLAAITFWYEFYYDVVLKGKYTERIRECHNHYGPIIRINPNEIHVDDPSLYEQIYVGPSRRTEKWAWSAQMFGTSMAAVGTLDHDVHRHRRAALNPFFSKRSIEQLEPLLQATIDRLYSRLNDFAGTGQPVNLSDAFACLSADTISQCAFGETYGLLKSENFAPEWRQFMMELSLGTHLMKQFGWAYRLIMSFAPSALSLVHPLSRRLAQLRSNISRQIETIRSQILVDKEGSQQTFFHSLLAGDLPCSEKSTARLTDEALTIIGAGTVTTAHTLATTFFHCLSEPQVLVRIQNELLGYNCNPTWTDLAKLPYLSAVIMEGLRLAFGVSHRLQRVSPDDDIVYKQWIIQAGTPVSQTQMFIMTDPELFPEPFSFIPERWITDELPAGFPEPSRTKRFFVPFSRGTRACVGINLAHAELFLTIGTLLAPIERGGKLSFELYGTKQKDMECAYDWFNPCPPLDSKGLRAVVV